MGGENNDIYVSRHHTAVSSGAPCSESGAMSIFKKKGTVESLFRIGAKDEETGHKGKQQDKGDGSGAHEVYYVRGRPFIAPTKNGAHLGTARDDGMDARASGTAPGSGPRRPGAPVPIDQTQRRSSLSHKGEAARVVVPCAQLACAQRRCQNSDRPSCC